MPGAPCFMKEEYAKYIDLTVAQTFSQMSQSPETTLRVNMLLKPLFEQLLKLRTAELTYASVFSGMKINGIHGEIRQCILAISTILKDTVKAYKVDVPNQRVSGPLGSMIKGKGYYEMLCFEGEASVEERVGPN